MTRRLHCMTILLLLFVCCCPTAQPQSCTPAPAGLVSWWSGDTNENDIVGGNNPSAVNAVTLAAGKVKTGFVFGTRGYVQIPAATNLANQQFTWTAWVLPAGPGTSGDIVGDVIVQQYAGSGSSNPVYLGWRGSDDRFVFFSGPDNPITSTDTFPTGTFYFVAGTYDGSTFQLFVNGVLEGALSAATSVAYSSQPWTIGNEDPGYCCRTWEGVIDEVQAYNRALSTPEIQAIYNAGSGGTCKGLTFSPTSLKFPRRTVGTTSPPSTVTATNQFPKPVTVKKVTTTGDFDQTNTCPVPPSKLATGATCAVNVTFTPTASDSRTGYLTINDDAPATPQRVKLTGRGTDISLSVSNLHFGSHNVGTTSRAKSVTVTNVGSVVVNFTGSGIVIAGTDPADYVISANACGPSLAAGATCTVSVEFKPTATGTKSATVDFNDDGGASPQTVALTGTGT